MSNVITLYDIPSKYLTDDTAWSPSTWKTRLALNYKNLPHKTEWVEFPDIENIYKDIGAAPIAPKVDARSSRPSYTVPVIYDPSTKTAVSNSADIARYLDKTYPDTPRLIPEGTDAFHAAFDDALRQVLGPKMMPVILLAECELLTPRSAEYFRRAKEARFGKLEEISPPGPVREGHLKALQDGFSSLAKWFEADGVSKPFVMGHRISYADLTLGAGLLSLRIVLGPDSEEWQSIRTWNEGRWERLLEHLAKYQVVV